MVSMFFRGETSASFFGSGVGLVASWDTPKIEDGSFALSGVGVKGVVGTGVLLVDLAGVGVVIGVGVFVAGTGVGGIGVSVGVGGTGVSVGGIEVGVLGTGVRVGVGATVGDELLEEPLEGVEKSTQDPVSSEFLPADCPVDGTETSPDDP